MLCTYIEVMGEGCYIGLVKSWEKGAMYTHIGVLWEGWYCTHAEVLGEGCYVPIFKSWEMGAI